MFKPIFTGNSGILGQNEQISLCVDGVSCGGAAWRGAQRGGDTCPRKAPRGPFEGQPSRNKGGHWGQTNDLSIFMPGSLQRGFISNFLALEDGAAASQALASGLLKIETEKRLPFGQLSGSMGIFSSVYLTLSLKWEGGGERSLSKMLFREKKCSHLFVVYSGLSRLFVSTPVWIMACVWIPSLCPTSMPVAG